MKPRTRHALVLGTVGLASSSAAWAFVVQVPEPGTLALFGAGLGSAILVARYLRKK